MHAPRRLRAASDELARVEVQLDQQPGYTRGALARAGQVLAEVKLAAGPSAWLEPVLHTMAELLDLAEDWNSYGARRVDPAGIAWALELLASTMSAETPAPTIVPTPRGGIELEWHTRGMDLEVHPGTQGGIYFYLEDQVRCLEEERELSTDRSPLVSALAELSRRS